MRGSLVAAARNAALLSFPGSDPKESHTLREDETRCVTRRLDKRGTWIDRTTPGCTRLWKFKKRDRNA